MLSQAPTDVVDALANYEMNLGMAFQLTNDILDVSTKMDSFQDHPVTRILEAATYMLPIIFTLHSGHSDEFETLLKQRRPDEKEIKRILSVLRTNDSAPLP